MKSAFFFCLVSILFLFKTNSSYGQIDPVDANGLAIGGYDVVAYFTLNKAVRGNQNIQSKFNNATYYFSSQDHKKSFDKTPEKFLPAYDGFCALAVATTAKKISINPELFRVTDGVLYLFYHGQLFSGNTFNSIEPWLENESKMIQKADANWPKVKVKKYNPKAK